MAAAADGFVDVTAEGDSGHFEQQSPALVGVKEVLQSLSLVFEAVAEFHLVHRVVLVALLGNGLAAAPTLVADVENGRLRGSPSAGLADEVVEVFEGGVGLDEQFDDEVLNLRRNSCYS